MLYIFTFDNGQIMLVEVMFSERAGLGRKVMDRAEAYRKYMHNYDREGYEPPDPFLVLEKGAVIDCSRVIGFGPYIDPSEKTEDA